MGRLQERVAPLLGFDPCVGGSPLERDRVVGDALARADDVAVGPRAFEHEGRVVARCELADHGTAERRSDLLVRIADVGDVLERVGSRLLEHLCGVEPGEQAPLHVRHAGTAGDGAIDPEGSLGHGAVVEDRVHVPDQQHAWTPRAAEGPDHEIAELGLAIGGDVGASLHLPSVPTEASLAEIGDPIHAGG